MALGRKIRGATDIGEIGNPKAVYRIHRDGVVVYTEWVLGGVGVRRRADQKIQPAFFFFGLGIKQPRAEPQKSELVSTFFIDMIWLVRGTLRTLLPSTVPTLPLCNHVTKD